MKTLDGQTDATDGLVLVRSTYMPPAGAALPSPTARVAVSPAANETFAGNTIPDVLDWETVTPAVAAARFAAAAVMVADPAATPVTGTDTLVAPCATFTVAGVVAAFELLELRLTVSAEAAGAERFSVRFCVVFALSERLAGQKLIVAAVLPPDVTCTCPLAVPYPDADAVIVADPAVPPVMLGTTRGELVIPSATKIVEGDTAAVPALLLASEMNTPPGGAGVPRDTGKLTELPGATVTFAGNRMAAVWKLHRSCVKSTAPLL